MVYSTDRSIVQISLLVLVVLFSLNLSNSAALSSATVVRNEKYQYRKVTGEDVDKINWRLRKGDTFVLTYSSAGEHHVTVAGKGYDTIRWTMVNKVEGTDLSAQRHGNLISLSGRFKGEAIDKTMEIDSGPWYQATSLSLRDLIASRETKRVFWTIRCDTLTAHQIVAVKHSEEIVQSGDDQLSLLHIRLTLPGMLAPFWKSDYWFSLPDGVFFRFEGPSGPPGSPKTTITRVTG